MRRLSLSLFSILLLALLAGCAKKPVPETPPSPMTETWLMAHTKISPTGAEGGATITQPRLAQQVRFGEGNATVYTTLAVETATKKKSDNYLLFFSMRADRWGNFTSAIDTLGLRYTVVPYTSYIRQGVYYENVFITLSGSWFESAGREAGTFLLLGPDSEISIEIPAVYPKALLHSLRRYREGNASAVTTAQDISAQ